MEIRDKRILDSKVGGARGCPRENNDIIFSGRDNWISQEQVNTNFLEKSFSQDGNSDKQV
jgi:hypothetical protein